MDERWQNARRILAVRLDNLGDVLMTTPAIRALKETGPERHITLLTSPAAAGVAKMIPEVDEVISYEAPWMKASLERKDSHLDFQMIERLQSEQFDAGVIFTVYSQNPLAAAMTLYMADIPLRLAYCRENPYQLLTNWVKETEPEKIILHEVRRQLELVKKVGSVTSNEQLSLQVSQQDVQSALAKLAATGVDANRPWVVIHPGSSAPSRRYAPDGFAETARELMAADGLQVVLTGVESECNLVEVVQSMSPGAFSLAGKLTLGEMAAVIKMTRLLIANNTGPVHMAAAVGTPVVVLYALTNPQHTPWNVASRVLYHDVSCKYCYKSVCPELHHNCLRLVQPTQVVQAAHELLQEKNRKPEKTRVLL